MIQAQKLQIPWQIIQKGHLKSFVTDFATQNASISIRANQEAWHWRAKLIIFADVNKGYGRWGDRSNDFHKMYVIQMPLSLFCVLEGENGHFYFVSTPQLRHCPEEWSPPTVGELWSQESSGGNRNIFISPVAEKNCLAGFMVMICIQTRTWWKSSQPSQPKTTVFTIPLGNCSKNFGNCQPAH